MEDSVVDIQTFFATPESHKFKVLVISPAETWYTTLKLLCNQLQSAHSSNTLQIVTCSHATFKSYLLRLSVQLGSGSDDKTQWLGHKTVEWWCWSQNQVIASHTGIPTHEAICEVMRLNPFQSCNSEFLSSMDSTSNRPGVAYMHPVQWQRMFRIDSEQKMRKAEETPRFVTVTGPRVVRLQVLPHNGVSMGKISMAWQDRRIMEHSVVEVRFCDPLFARSSLLPNSIVDAKTLAPLSSPIISHSPSPSPSPSPTSTSSNIPDSSPTSTSSNIPDSSPTSTSSNIPDSSPTSTSSNIPDSSPAVSDEARFARIGPSFRDVDAKEWKHFPVHENDRQPNSDLNFDIEYFSRMYDALAVNFSTAEFKKWADPVLAHWPQKQDLLGLSIYARATLLQLESMKSFADLEKMIQATQTIITPFLQPRMDWKVHLLCRIATQSFLAFLSTIEFSKVKKWYIIGIKVLDSIYSGF